MQDKSIITPNFDYFDLLKTNMVDGVGRLDLNDFIDGGWITDDMEDLWIKNYIKNKPFMNTYPRTGCKKDKVCIIIGASPAIKRQIETLKEISTDPRFFILSANGPYKFLLSNGIVPEYVFAVESRDHIVNDLSEAHEDTTLISSPFISNKITRIWVGKHYFYLLGGGKRYGPLLENDFPGNVDIGGGNVVSTSMLWAYKYLGCRNFIFCGMSLCYYDDYYFDGRTTKYVVSDIEKYKSNYQAIDMHGNAVNTTPALTMYKTWLETYTRYAEDTVFINSTEDGILGVYPEPIEMEGTIIKFTVSYIPWMSIVPLKIAIDGYKQKFKES